jgi:hypothetical protein
LLRKIFVSGVPNTGCSGKYYSKNQFYFILVKIKTTESSMNKIENSHLTSSTKFDSPQEKVISTPFTTPIKTDETGFFKLPAWAIVVIIVTSLLSKHIKINICRDLT